jgi:hypothetical protein
MSVTTTIFCRSTPVGSGRNIVIARLGVGDSTVDELAAVGERRTDRHAEEQDRHMKEGGGDCHRASVGR